MHEFVAEMPCKWEIPQKRMTLFCLAVKSEKKKYR
jgi:hypothetical protein